MKGSDHDLTSAKIDTSDQRDSVKPWKNLSEGSQFMGLNLNPNKVRVPPTQWWDTGTRCKQEY